MTTSGQERWLRRICGTLLQIYPEEFRKACGREMEDAYVDRLAASRRRGVQGAFLRTVGLMVWHSMRDGAFERIEIRRNGPEKGDRGIIMGTILYDIRHSLRSLRKKPSSGFAIRSLYLSKLKSPIKWSFPMTM